MPFKKGQSGNPGGRPKSNKTALECIRLHIKENDIMLMVVTHAQAGDTQMIKLLAEYAFGRPVQKTENDNYHNFPTELQINIVKPAKREE